MKMIYTNPQADDSKYHQLVEEVVVIKKPSKALQLIVEAIGILLQIPIEDPVEKTAHKSNLYVSTLHWLVSNGPKMDEIINSLMNLESENASNLAVDHFFKKVLHSDYNVDKAICEGGGRLVQQFGEINKKFLEKIEKECVAFRRPHVNTTFVIAVDGSRLSYYAFEVGIQLRRFGFIYILYIDESNDQRDYFSAEFIIQDYERHCLESGLDRNQFKVIKSSSLLNNQSTATNIVKKCRELQVDFIIVGAFGRAGPQILQIGHTPKALLAESENSFIIVPPSLSNMSKVLCGVTRIFIIAVRVIEVGSKCFDTTLKLLKPKDKLYVVFIYNEKETKEDKIKDFNSVFSEKIKSTKIDGEIISLVRNESITLVENINDFVHDKKGMFLVIGEHCSNSINQKEHTSGSITQGLCTSPRCILVICK